MNELKTHYDSLVLFQEVKENFLSRQEEFPMETQLKHEPQLNHKSERSSLLEGEAATKTYVDATSSTIVSNTAASIAAKLDLSGGKMLGSIDMNKNKIINLPEPTEKNDAVNMEFLDSKIDDLNKKITKNTITATSHPKDEFRYLMEDVDESSSESNIVCDRHC